MEGLKVFEKLVSAGNPVGEITGIDSFMVNVKGLQPTNVHATVRFDEVPLIAEARTLVQQGIATGASTRNWASYGESVELEAGADLWHQKMLTDPQTSGGLLVSCAADEVGQVLAAFHETGFESAAAIGSLHQGIPKVNVRAFS